MGRWEDSEAGAEDPTHIHGWGDVNKVAESEHQYS